MGRDGRLKMETDSVAAPDQKMNRVPSWCQQHLPGPDHSFYDKLLHQIGGGNGLQTCEIKQARHQDSQHGKGRPTSNKSPSHALGQPSQHGIRSGKSAKYNTDAVQDEEDSDRNRKAVAYGTCDAHMGVEEERSRDRMDKGVASKHCAGKHDGQGCLGDRDDGCVLAGIGVRDSKLDVSQRGKSTPFAYESENNKPRPKPKLKLNQKAGGHKAIEAQAMERAGGAGGKMAEGEKRRAQKRKEKAPSEGERQSEQIYAHAAVAVTGEPHSEGRHGQQPVSCDQGFTLCCIQQGGTRSTSEEGANDGSTRGTVAAKRRRKDGSTQAHGNDTYATRPSEPPESKPTDISQVAKKRLSNHGDAACGDDTQHAGHGSVLKHQDADKARGTNTGRGMAVSQPKKRGRPRKVVCEQSSAREQEQATTGSMQSPHSQHAIILAQESDKGEQAPASGGTAKHAPAKWKAAASLQAASKCAVQEPQGQPAHSGAVTLPDAGANSQAQARSGMSVRNRDYVSDSEDDEVRLR
jgi:hypothetical protein